MFQFFERPDSRSMTLGAEKSSLTKTYKAVGSTDDQYVAAFARAAIPLVIATVSGTLYRGDLRVDPDGWNQWIVSAPYNSRKKQTGSYTWSFDTTGATVRVTAAKQHVASFPQDANNPNPHGGSIGVTKDGHVEGAEIIIPALKLQVQFRHPLGAVSLSLVKRLARLTGMTNSAPWLDGHFDAGELLYLGSRGSDGSESEADVTYQFAASENVSNLSFGDIAGVVKKGHHYAWVEYKDEPSGAGEAATRPKRVHVERVYNEADFAAEFGWG